MADDKDFSFEILGKDSGGSTPEFLEFALEFVFPFFVVLYGDLADPVAGFQGFKFLL